MTTQDPTDHQATPDFTSKVIRSFTSRRAITLGIGFWAAALIELVFYVNRIGPVSDVDFALFEIWMLGAGFGGSPILAIRALGRHLTDRGCLLLGFGAFTAALLLTGLTLGGQMHPSPLAITFSLVPLLAFAIHCVNGAEVQYKTARLQERIELLEAENRVLASSVRSLRESLDSVDVGAELFYEGRKRGLELARDASLGRLENLLGKKIPAEALEDWCLRMTEDLEEALGGQHPDLHVVPAIEAADTVELPKPSQILPFRRLARGEPWTAAPEAEQPRANGHRAPGS